MKKLNIKRTVLAIVAMAASGAYAAVVDTHTPGGINPASYDVVSGETPDLVYSNLTALDHTALVNPSFNSGHELVYLGLHTPFTFGQGNAFAESNQVDVNVNNISGSATTGSVSLVLVAQAAVSWNINVQNGVQLENIFVFSGNQINRNNTAITVNGSSTIAAVSLEDACGYSLPQNEGGCSTNDILGIEDPVFEFVLNDFLADLTPFKVTNFNGTYYANQFDVGIDTAVVPLPTSAWLFGSALFFLFQRRFTIK